MFGSVRRLLVFVIFVLEDVFYHHLIDEFVG